MTELDKLVRDNVIRLAPYSSARDEFNGKTGIFLDANENPYGNLNRYPDPYQRELKSVIAGIKGISEESIFLGNGSDEIIDLCFRVFCNPGIDKIVTFTPTYGMYEVSASVNDIETVRVPLNSDFQIDLKNAASLFNDKSLKMIFICSPNNPTGNSMNYPDVISILETFGGIVVIDEAYNDFSGKPSFTTLLGNYSNLIVMQTFSKAYGLAAARVGMAFTNPAIVHYFNKLKPPYNISTINQKAAMNRLVKTDLYQKQVSTIRKERARLAGVLSQMSFVKMVYPSDANFLLIKVKEADNLYNILVSKNIIIRNRSKVLDNCLRITVGKKWENDILIKTLNELDTLKKIL